MRLVTTVFSIFLAVSVEAQWNSLFNWQQQHSQPAPAARPQQWSQQPQQLQWNQAWQQQQPAQNFFNQPFGQPQPNILGNVLNQFTLAPPPTITTAAPETTTIRLEDIPNPDLEQGNFPMPNPSNWPVGPDWNDDRNSWAGEFGWGGKDVNRQQLASIIRAADGQF